MGGFAQKLKDFLIRPSHSRTAGIIMVLVLFAAVQMTIIFNQEQKTLRQRAEVNEDANQCIATRCAQFDVGSDDERDCALQCIREFPLDTSAPPPTAAQVAQNPTPTSALTPIGARILCPGPNGPISVEGTMCPPTPAPAASLCSSNTSCANCLTKKECAWNVQGNSTSCKPVPDPFTAIAVCSNNQHWFWVNCSTDVCPSSLTPQPGGGGNGVAPAGCEGDLGGAPLRCGVARRTNEIQVSGLDCLDSSGKVITGQFCFQKILPTKPPAAGDGGAGDGAGGTTPPTPAPTPTSAPTKIALSLVIPGIGNNVDGGDNNKLIHPNGRIVNVVATNIADPKNKKTGEGTVDYAVASGKFVGTANIAGLNPTATYSLIIKMGDFLKAFPKVTLEPSVQASVAASLRVGIDDKNNTSILYFETMRSCYGSTLGTKKNTCKNLPDADVNDDGRVNSLDYNFFLRSVSKAIDSTVPAPTPTPTKTPTPTPTKTP